VRHVSISVLGCGWSGDEGCPPRIDGTGSRPINGKSLEPSVRRPVISYDPVRGWSSRVKHGPHLGVACKGGLHQFLAVKSLCRCRRQLVTRSKRVGSVAAGIVLSWMRSWVVLIAASDKQDNRQTTASTSGRPLGLAGSGARGSWRDVSGHLTPAKNGIR
jgi:hypothetical protein